MPQTQDPRGTLYLENPQKSDHGPPPEGCHGLVLPNPSRAAFIGGVSSGKTCCILNTVARCHAWKPFDGGIYLLSPNNEAVRDGEYGIIDDITCLDHWPELKYWEERPGRKCLGRADRDRRSIMQSRRRCMCMRNGSILEAATRLLGGGAK